MKKLSIVLLVLIIIGCTNQQSKDKEFIKVKGSKFYIDNNPYYFCGTNMYYAAYLGASEEGRKRLIKELDLLKEYGITNLRILGASELSSFKYALPQCFQTNARAYNEQLLQGLDFVLYEMYKRNMHAVIYLNNYWNWSGGMAKYMEWATGEKSHDPEIDKNWKKYMINAAMFYTNDTAQSIYKDYIKMLVNRKNTYSNLLYKNDPTIMAWQLSNEPRPGPDKYNDSINIEILSKWVDQTAQYIHSLDTNHLVCTGSEGIVGAVQNPEGYLKIHSSKFIDYINFHLWPKNWSWYDAMKPEKTFPVAVENAINYINKHILFARQLNKPITLEEFGLERDSAKYQPGTSVKYRNDFYKSILTLISDSISNGAPIAGINFWAWGGYGIPSPIEEVKIENPSSFLGDPLGEPQGLNSVFASDTSTLFIFKEFNKKLHEK